MAPGSTLLLMLLACAAFVGPLVLLAWVSRRIATRRRAGTVELVAGGLYSVKSGETFRIAKVLVIEDGICHVRVYKNRFDARPADIDPAALAVGTIGDEDGFGVGHLPLGREAFLSWAPTLLRRTDVTADELEGYEIWQQDHGGHFT